MVVWCPIFEERKKEKKVFSNFKLRDPLCSVSLWVIRALVSRRGKWSRWGGYKGHLDGWGRLTKEALASNVVWSPIVGPSCCACTTKQGG